MAKWKADLEEQTFGYWSQETKPQTITEMVREFATKTGQTPNADLYDNLISEEFYEFRKEEPHTADELKELADLVYVCYGYANALGYDLEEAVCRVHENNMGRMYQPDGTIKRRADGKIEKNKDYPKVDLSDLV